MLEHEDSMDMPLLGWGNGHVFAVQVAEVFIAVVGRRPFLSLKGDGCERKDALAAVHDAVAVGGRCVRQVMALCPAGTGDGP